MEQIELIIELPIKIDLSNILKTETIVSLGCSANREILITTRTNTQSDRETKRYLHNLYLEIDNTLILYAAIEEKCCVSHFQLLNNNEIILISILSYHRNSDFEKNGFIYSDKGEYKRQILLGDGIADIQVNESGIIWTSYFDEGIFGNRGWNDPIGKNGLVAWNALGGKVYEFFSALEPGKISDCYALNVISEREVWLYYYTEFPLVKLKDYKIQDYWFVPIKGSHAFAIYRNFALFNGGYKDGENFYLVRLEKNHQSKIIRQIKLENISEISYISARRDTLYFLSEQKVFQLSVFDAMTNYNI